MNLPNIKYKGDLEKTVKSKDDFYQQISYYKTIDDFIDETSYTKYVKEVEKLVRTSVDYKAFIDYIKNTVGLNFCQVFSKIYDKVDATIEFHHSPFTLYDICEVELAKFIKLGKRINTFRIADSVLDLHFAMKIGGVLLSTTAHEMIHEQELFINLNQHIGDINQYIKENSEFFTPEVKYKLWNYVNICKTNESFDKSGLDLETIKTYVSAS